MQFNTMLKLGGLAFDVAQDDKVRELATILHKGAKRRGIYGAPPASDQTANAKTEEHPIPFAPKTEEKKPATAAKLPPGIHLPPQVGFPNAMFGKYMNAGNAQKMKQWAGEISQWLIKK